MHQFEGPWHHITMPKRIKQQERPRDVNELARALVDESTGEADVALPTKAQVSALMARLGRKGGKIGGKRRLKTMTAEQRRDVARKAAEARWSRANGSKNHS